MSGGGNAGRRRGRARELDVIQHFRERGCVAYRLAHGHADVVVLKAGVEPLLVQVKSTRRPYERFGPDDRRELALEAIMAGALAVLAHWPLRGKLTLIGSDQWPRVQGEPPPNAHCFYCGTSDGPRPYVHAGFLDVKLDVDDVAEAWVCAREHCREQLLDDAESKRDGFRPLSADVHAVMPPDPEWS